MHRGAVFEQTHLPRHSACTPGICGLRGISGRMGCLPVRRMWYAGLEGVSKRETPKNRGSWNS